MISCLITPVRELEYTNLLPGYFCLAQECKKSTNYKDFFTARAAEGKYVILDNGAFEGEAVGDTELLDLAHEIKPSVLICPDEVNSDFFVGLIRAQEFRDKATKDHYMGDLMFVPQTIGGNLTSLADIWRYSYTEEFAYLGLSRNFSVSMCQHVTQSQDMEVNRLYLAQKLVDLNIVAEAKKENIKWHFLGMGCNYEFIRNYWFAHSIDTAWPVWRASCAEYRNRPPNYMTREFITSTREREALEVACANILREVKESELLRARIWKEKV